MKRKNKIKGIVIDSLLSKGYSKGEAENFICTLSERDIEKKPQIKYKKINIFV